jgi:hypothetical protein
LEELQFLGVLNDQQVRVPGQGASEGVSRRREPEEQDLGDLSGCWDGPPKKQPLWIDRDYLEGSTPNVLIAHALEDRDVPKNRLDGSAGP